MKRFNIQNFVKGWFIGRFYPNVLFNTEIEIGHHKYPKGFVGEPHFHKIAVEINYLVTGRAKITTSRGVEEFGPGDGFIIKPGEYVPVEYLEDTDLIIIKSPSILNDKYTI